MNDLSVVHLHKKKPSIIKAVLSLIGAIGLLVSLLMFFFIGPFAILPLIGAFVFLSYGKSYQQATCAKCGYHKNSVENKKDNFKCKRCKTLNVIQWDEVEHSI